MQRAAEIFQRLFAFFGGANCFGFARVNNDFNKTISQSNLPPNSRSTSGGITTESKSAGKMSNLPTRSKPIKQVLSETTISLTIRVPHANRRANS